MTFPWQRRPMYTPPERERETPSDLYARLLETKPFSELAWALARTLGGHDEKPQAIQFALRLASDPEPAQRWTGAIALVRLHCEGYREAERALWKLLQDPSASVRAKIAEELRWDDLPETATLKQALAKDPSPKVRVHATTGLYLFSDETSRNTLLAMTQDPNGEVRAEALESLQAIENNPPNVQDFIHFERDPAPLVRAALACWLRFTDHGFALPHLLNLVHDDDELVRGRAVQSLDDFEDPETWDALVQSASDPSSWIRALSLRILGKGNTDEVLALLIARASDSSPEVRKVAAQQLERRVTPALLPVLEKLCEDEGNAITRRAALRSLEQIPGEEAELLITRMLRDPSQMVVAAAKKVLEKRAKTEPIAPGTAYELRYGRERGVATRLAFHGRSTVPLKAWQKFLDDVQRLDGRGKADSVSSPAIQVETTAGAHHCILPFGPAHWIRVDYAPQRSASALMGYMVATTQEIEAWFKTIDFGRIAHGSALAKRLGWYDGTTPRITDAASSHRRKGRPAKGNAIT